MTKSSTYIGDRVRMTTTHSDGSLITFTCRVVKTSTKPGTSLQKACVEYPQSVLDLPFPPNHGKRYGWFYTKDLHFMPNVAT